MGHVNIEIKARCADQERVRKLLEERNADFRGLDHQVDTYFNAPSGRLKLREGNIENTLIHYDRTDQEGPKQSNVTLYHLQPSPALKDILTKTLGVKVVVDKRREIYFINNVKFHLDRVEGLGTFVEIEAIDADGSIGTARLHEQCQYYIALFGIREQDLLSQSYSDMLIK
jgi:predicted adenylyl cyclase CyaB